MTQQDSDATAANQAAASLELLTSNPCELVESGAIADAQSASLTLASDATAVGLKAGTADTLVASLSSYVDADACVATDRRRRRLGSLRHLRTGRRLASLQGDAADPTTGAIQGHEENGRSTFERLSLEISPQRLSRGGPPRAPLERVVI